MDVCMHYIDMLTRSALECAITVVISTVDAHCIQSELILRDLLIIHCSGLLDVVSFPSFIYSPITPPPLDINIILHCYTTPLPTLGFFFSLLLHFNSCLV